MKKIAKILFFGLIVLVGTVLVSFNAIDIKGWILAGSKPGSYEIGIEKDANRNENVGYLKSVDKTIDGFGTIMQSFEPLDYLGKMVKLKGKIKSENINDWAGMWMRVDGQMQKNGRREVLAFDNMQSRPIKGTSEWKEYIIVLEVPEQSTNLSYGVLLSGTGNIWLDDFRFEIVKNGQATTDSSKSLNLKKPTNTSFEDFKE